MSRVAWLWLVGQALNTELDGGWSTGPGWMPVLISIIARGPNVCNWKTRVFIIIIIIKKDRQCKAGRGRLTHYQSEDPSPTLPTYRGKEEKGKIVEDKKGESN